MGSQKARRRARPPNQTCLHHLRKSSPSVLQQSKKAEKQWWTMRPLNVSKLLRKCKRTKSILRRKRSKKLARATNRKRRKKRFSIIRSLKLPGRGSWINIFRKKKIAPNTG